MKKNVGSIDKTVRLLIALAVVVVASTRVATGTLALILVFVAALLVITSLLGTCPMYIPFGISTAKKKS